MLPVQAPPFDRLGHALQSARGYLEKVGRLNARYRAGDIHAHVPPLVLDADYTLEEAFEAAFPISHALRERAAHGLFASLPVAFDPSESVGPFLATIDRDASGEPYRFLDLGAQIATQALGENHPALVEAVVQELPYAVCKNAHSEYQTALSLRCKAELARVAPEGTPRVFVVNTGAEAVENGIKAALLNRVLTSGQVDGGFFISFDHAFHGRTLGSLAVTQRKKARLGFPTFDWPHATFPFDDPRAPRATDRREEKALREIWELLITGRRGGIRRTREAFRRELAAIDGALAGPAEEIPAFVEEAAARVAPEIRERSRRVAGVLVEPIQGEGGVRMATPRFFRRLRLLTRIHDVPLLFDEVQTGGGITGTFWAHEAFDLPLPPDAVMWAKKSQCGVLFVSEELATFFQAEKKFNTTWEGDSVGAVRLLATLNEVDLAEARRTGEHSRVALDALSREFPEFIQDVRGVGCMLAFDVARADWRDVVRERAFRLGLILLPAGDRTLRFYPRFDMERYAIDEAVDLFRRAILEVIARPAEKPSAGGLKVRVGAFDCPRACLEPVDLDVGSFPVHRDAVMAVEVERYGSLSQYPADVLRSGRRPLLQYTDETLESTLGAGRSIGLALRDRVSGRVVAYAVGSPLENHDEQGVREDPHYGDGNTFYLQAMATLPSIRNAAEVEGHLLDRLLARVAAEGFDHVSTLIEGRFWRERPAWIGRASQLRTVENYLGSGIDYVYLTATVNPEE